jgi:hypothetical protein
LPQHPGVLGAYLRQYRDSLNSVVEINMTLRMTGGKILAREIENPVPDALCPSQIPHGLARE